jgi:hypothetical protein
MFNDARYEVKATCGRKVLFRAYYEAYEDALDALVEVEETWQDQAEYDFIDHSPFAR